MTREPTEEERRREAASYEDVESIKERAQTKLPQEPWTSLERPTSAPESRVSIERESLMKEEPRQIPTRPIETEVRGEREFDRPIRVPTTTTLETEIAAPMKPISVPIYSIQEEEEEEIYEEEPEHRILPPSQYQQEPGPQFETPVKPVIGVERPTLSIPPTTIEPEKKKPSISIERRVSPQRETKKLVEPVVPEKKIRQPRQKAPKEIPPLTIQTRGRSKQPSQPTTQGPTGKTQPTTIATRARPSRGGRTSLELETKPTTAKRETQPKKPPSRKRGRARKPQAKSKRLREEITTTIPTEPEAEKGKLEEEWEEEEESIPIEVSEPSSVTMILEESELEEEPPSEQIQVPSSQGNIKIHERMNMYSI